MRGSVVVVGSVVYRIVIQLALTAGDVDGVDFVSRMFAPAIGIPEDPVTGSAHCVLAPYWSSVTWSETRPTVAVVRVRRLRALGLGL